jgi:hypothetical protein
MFQKKGQLGHPDEINAKEISLGRQINMDDHGLKKSLFRLWRERTHSK